MTTAQPESNSTRASEVSMTSALSAIERMLDGMAERMFDPDFYEGLHVELRRFHARLRTHHAVEAYHAGGESIAQISPEYADQIARLRSEHSVILGMLDRLIRCVESMCDQPLEDKEVFTMRTRELIAVVRRHEAEEDRLLYLSLWRDTGGES